MTLEQFKEKVEAYKTLHKTGYSVRIRDEVVRELAHEIAMNAMDVLKAVGEEAHKEMDECAEMLWVVLANVSNGNWEKQDEEWQKAARRWADNYHSKRWHNSDTKKRLDNE